jgi:hypothetical protein
MDKSIFSLQTVNKGVIFCSLLTLAFFLGSNFNQNETLLQKDIPNTDLNRDLNAKIEVKLVETHTTQYVEKPLEQMNLRNFFNLDELRKWLDTQQCLMSYYLYTTHTDQDCDDYANELQRKALEDGYLMSFQIIDAEKYNGLFDVHPIPVNTLHAINLVLIDNNAYYIEPQTGEIRLAAYLD